MQELLTVANALDKSALLKATSDSARLDTEVLLASVLQKDRSYLYTWPEKHLDQAQSQQFLSALQRRIDGEPVAYIIGEKEFWSLNLWVDPSTLIPRADTETLVETALSLFSNDVAEQQRTVIDLGTGTGAIALALALEKPHWQIIAVDKSASACQLAEKNRQKYQLNNVSVIHSDWLDAVENVLVNMVISNPPYIEENDPHLQQGDVRFEPLSALVADNNGLADIEYIAQQSKQYLRTGGYLLIEHGYQQTDAVMAVFQQQQYQHCRMVRDMAGQARMTMGQYYCE